MIAKPQPVSADELSRSVKTSVLELKALFSSAKRHTELKQAEPTSTVERKVGLAPQLQLLPDLGFTNSDTINWFREICR